MGGKAFGFEADRMNKYEFDIVCESVLDLLTKNGVKAKVVPSYRAKDSFGDVDVVVENKGDMYKTLELVKEYYIPEYTHKNGTVFSFSFELDLVEKIVQVDLVFATPKHFEQSYRYLSYNDLWNLLGKLAHRQGFKLSHEGLMVQVRNGDYTLGDVLVTNGLKEMFEVLDVSVEDYNSGFDTREDLFEFTTNSKWFTKATYALEELNHINRRRNAKRTVYMNFLKWMEDKDLNTDSTKVDKEARVREVLENYPEARAEVEALWEKRRLQQLTKEVFNGNMVMEWTGLQGKELGNLMKVLNSKYNMDFWLNCENVQEVVLNEFKGS